jgi:hypothetical protein
LAIPALPVRLFKASTNDARRPGQASAIYSSPAEIASCLSRVMAGLDPAIHVFSKKLK